MTEATALPLVFVFGLVTVLIVRSGEVPWWMAVLIGLFGFYLGQTAANFMISDLVSWVLSRLTA